MSTINSALMASSLPLAPTRDGDGKSSKTNPQEAARVAQDFESVFASLMLKEMRKTLEPGAMFGEDSGDVYGGLFDLYLGQQMSQSGGFGLAKMVREALQRAERSPAEQSAGVVAADAAHAIEG
ncbi:MAG: rod-binding protein [Planctomycetota bacterium]